MIEFFPRTYKDEIAYSIFARYGVLNGNTGFRQTSNELFGTEISSHSVYYSMYLDNFINQLPVEMGVIFDDFIKNHTIFPLFKPFMAKARVDLVIKNMRYESTRSLKDRMGINSGNIFNQKRQIIKICPLCFKEEVDKYGEAYAYRLHQIPGNLICDKHEVYLCEYSIPTNKNVLFDINDIDTGLLKNEEIENSLKEYYLNLSHDIRYVLDEGYGKYDKDKIQDIYRNKLKEKGYLNGIRINQRKLMNDFKKLSKVYYI